MDQRRVDPGEQPADTHSLAKVLEAFAAAWKRKDPVPDALKGWHEVAGYRSVALCQRQPDGWAVLATAGPWDPQRCEHLQSKLAEALDRMTVLSVREGERSWIICPLDETLCASTCFVAEVTGDPPSASYVAAACQALGWLVAAHRERQELRERLEDLERLLQAVRGLAGCQDTTELLEKIAATATELLDAERASIFIYDAANERLVARPALGIQGGELSVPVNYGVVGDVFRRGQVAIVNDVQQDPRFREDVDRQTGFRTRSLLAVPLKSPSKKLGVFEVLNKRNGRFDERDRWLLERLADQVAVVLEDTAERERLARVARADAEQRQAAARIVGNSRAMAELRNTIAQLAKTDLPVLILGESGTGKEVVARAIHLNSPRRKGPFVAVNCAAIAETLLESELFGHERGAFTDARESRPGKFELAQGGTLFLDEIGDMSEAGQAKLLRVLEEKTIYRVGGTRLIPVDVRVIAATNRDLAKLVQEGKFREDLYYRLTVVTVQIPPLRQRRDDILPLAEYFLEQFCRDAGREPLKLTKEAQRCLLEHSWPGNVRELRNLMERLAFLAPGPEIGREEIERVLTATAVKKEEHGIAVPLGSTLAEATAEFQRRYIAAAIELAGGNVAEAGRRLGVHRSNLYRKMRQLGMSRPKEDGR